MKLSIEDFTTITGWTINSPSLVALNEFRDYIAGIRNDASLIAQFSAEDTTRTLTKSLTAVDVTDYKMLVFSIWSQNKSKSEYGRNVEADFNYKIKINSTDEYYLPIRPNFTDININIEDVTTIDRIEITAIHTGFDNIILSEMVVEYEEMPIDLLVEIQDAMEFYLNRNTGLGELLGTITASTGDINIDTGDYNYLDRYAVILIDDGVNSETHQICEMNDNTSSAEFNDNYDGKSILNDYTNANMYIIFPVYINPDERDVRLPGMCIWGITPESILRTGKTDTFIEAYKVGGDMIIRKEGHVWKYLILIDCDSRASSLNAIMTKAVRDFGANEVVWVNGRKHELDFGNNPTEIRPAQGIDIIPKIQYQLYVEVIENILPAETVVNADAATININVVEEIDD